MYLCRDLAQASYPSIGKDFGNKNHSTVIHAYNKMAKMHDKDDGFKQVIKTIINKLQS